jgi:exosortase
VRLITPATAVRSGLLFLAFVGLFFRWFRSQHEWSWNFPEDWAHAYFIPVISGYLIWQRRQELMALRPAVFWPALAPFLLGIACYFLGVVGVKNHMVQGWSIILTLFGLVFLLLGPSIMRLLLVPILYLVFAVTVSEKIMITITFPLQLLAAQGAGVILRVLGAVFNFGAEVDGNVLTVITSAGKPVPLDVAEACAGMRMVIAFFALGAAVAVLACRHWWQRVTLLLLAAPIALLMNSIRVAVLGIAALFDQKLASGGAHQLIGTILLLPSLGLFMLVVWALNRVVDEPPHRPAPPPSPRVAMPWRVLRGPAFVVALTVMAVSALGMGVSIRAAKIYLQKKPITPPAYGTGTRSRTLNDLPRETESWTQQGQDSIESAEVLETLGTSNYVTRVYGHKEPDPDHRGQFRAAPPFITLHAAYYTGMIDTVPHVPERCFVGSGMSIVGGPWTVPAPLNTAGWRPDADTAADQRGPLFTTRTSNLYSELHGKRVRLPRGLSPGNPDLSIRVNEYAPGTRQGAGGGGPAPRVFAGYFFIANGGTVSSAEGVRLLAFNLSDDYAYYLKIQFTSTGVQSAEDLGRAAGGLLDDLLGELMLCVPDWTDVEQGRYPPDNPRRAAARDETN